MFLQIEVSSMKFNYDVGALNDLLRRVESTIKENQSVFTAIQAATTKPMTATAKSRYKHNISTDELLEYLTPGKPPAVIPMHQMYIAPGPDPDWVMKAMAGPPLRIIVLAELLLLWQDNQNSFFLTAQLVSIISMGLVTALMDSLGMLTTFDDVVELGPKGIPSHLKSFAKDAFGSLNWDKDYYLPSRVAFDTYGYSLPVPNPNATHPP